MPSLGPTPGVTRVYEALKKRRSATRPELSTDTGLSLPAVGTCVDLLVDSGLAILKEVRADGQRGRPAVQVTVCPEKHTVAVADVSGPRLLVGLFDMYGQLLQRSEGPSAFSFIGMAPGDIAALVGDELAQLGPAAGYGATVTGIVKNGIVERSLFFIKGTPYNLQDTLERRLGMPVTIENDAKAAAFGEYHARGCNPSETLMYLNYAHALGMGLVIDGRLHRGAHAAAGNFALIPASAEDLLNSKSTPPMMTAISKLFSQQVMAAILRAIPALGMKELATRIWFGRDVDVHDPIGSLMEQSLAGKASARETLNVAARQAALLLSACAATVDPDLIVLQDAWPHTREVILKPIAKHLAGRVHAKIELSKAGVTAGLSGIALMIAGDLEEKLLAQARQRRSGQI